MVPVPPPFSLTNTAKTRPPSLLSTTLRPRPSPVELLDVVVELSSVDAVVPVAQPRRLAAAVLLLDVAVFVLVLVVMLAASIPGQLAVAVVVAASVGRIGTNRRGTAMLPLLSSLSGRSLRRLTSPG